jgi:hypothetical protein
VARIRQDHPRRPGQRTEIEAAVERCDLQRRRLPGDELVEQLAHRPAAPGRRIDLAGDLVEPTRRGGSRQLERRRHVHRAQAFPARPRVGGRIRWTSSDWRKAAQPTKSKYCSRGNGIERRQECLCFAGDRRDIRGVELGLGQIAQAMTPCMLGERMKENRFVRHGEIVMADLAVAALGDRTQVPVRTCLIATRAMPIPRRR